jgi:excisionase family DNA binding protein
MDTLADGRSRSPSGSADGGEQEGPRLLSRGTVARLFGVSASTVTRWAQRGLLPAVRTPGGHYRFRADDVKRVAERSGLTEMTRLD